MSDIIQLTFEIGDDYTLKSVSFELNTTDLPDNSQTIKRLAIALLISLNLNKDSLLVQDLLNELNIKPTP